LAVIELKMAPDDKAIPQARRYAEYLRQQDSDTWRFFSELSHAMAPLYGCGDLPKQLEPGRARALAAWPSSRGAEVDTVIRCT
jgi:hypothetical protein